MSGAIVVGYTATDAGADAAALGARLARSLDARLHLVIVLPSEGTRNAAVPPARAYEDVIRAQGKKWLSEAMAALAQDVTRSGHVRFGESFAEALIAAGREFGARLIVVGGADGAVLGTHRLGGVASALVHSSPIPVALTPGYATIIAAVVASAFYAVMRFISEDVLWDTITALGMMICFYYGITAFACVWYFRRQWFDSARAFFFTLLFPLVGGVILAALFVMTLVDSMDPGYGSGSNIAGIGLVFILGVTVIVVGIIIMIWQAIKRPAFFRGETLTMDAPPSLRHR